MMDTLPTVTRGLLDLFEGPLRDVRFPDADRDGLLEAIEDAARAREALVRAELALQAARECLDERMALVARRTDRSLAYARIYAAERPELAEALASLAEPTPAPRPRGRPRKERPAFVAPEGQVELAMATPKRRAAPALESAAE